MPEGAEDGNVRVHEVFPGAAVWHFLLMTSSLTLISPHPSLNRSSAYLRYSEFSHSQKRLSKPQKSALIDGPLSRVTLILESLDFHRTCPGVPLEQFGPFPTSTQNGMPWSSSQRWRRKVEVESCIRIIGEPFFPAVLTSTSTSTGSDAEPVVRILTNRSNAQRQVIAKTFGEIAQKVTHLATVQRQVCRRIVRRDPRVALCGVACCVCSPVCLLIKHNAVWWQSVESPHLCLVREQRQSRKQFHSVCCSLLHFSKHFHFISIFACWKDVAILFTRLFHRLFAIAIFYLVGEKSRLQDRVATTPFYIMKFHYNFK